MWTAAQKMLKRSFKGREKRDTNLCDSWKAHAATAQRLHELRGGMSTGHPAKPPASCSCGRPGRARVAPVHAPAFTKQTHKSHIRSNFRIFPALPQSSGFHGPTGMFYKQGSHTGCCQPVTGHWWMNRTCTPGIEWPWVIHRVGDAVLQPVAISGKHVMLLYSTTGRYNESSPTTVLGPSNFIYIIRIAVMKRINLPTASEFLISKFCTFKIWKSL